MKDLINPPAAVRQVEDLDVLAQQINEREEQGVRSLLEHARAQGDDLIRAKKGCGGHGKWLPWLQANVRFDRRTATRYMQIAGKWDTVSHLGSMREALSLLSQDTPPEDTGHSDRLDRWLRLVQGESLAIEVECGGIGKMLSEPDKWDWPRVRDHILPDMETLQQRLSDYTKEIRNHVERNG